VPDPALPFVDEIGTEVAAPPDRVWAALGPVLTASFAGGAAPLLARALGCAHTERSPAGPDGLAAGATMPGFAVAEAAAGRRLALEGRHRYARYALVLVLRPVAADRCLLSAQTWAAFPGAAGRAYRALVIGTGGHAVVVRRLLGTVRRRAEQGRSA
jgi:hypothetical protein